MNHFVLLDSNFKFNKVLVIFKIFDIMSTKVIGVNNYDIVFYNPNTLYIGGKNLIMYNAKINDNLHIYKSRHTQRTLYYKK